jgi:hypothetical protein
LAYGVKQAREEAGTFLTFVGEVSHVGLEYDGAPAGKGRGIVNAHTELGGFLDGKGKSFHQLPEEIACTLGAAVVFAQHFQAARAQLQY